VTDILAESGVGPTTFA